MNRIYVACLASYNNGELHGKWIEASTDVEAMQSEVNEVLRTSKYPNVTVVICEEYPVTCSIQCRHNDVNRWYMKEIENHPGFHLSQVAPKYIPGKAYEVLSAEEYAIHDFEGEALEDLKEYCGLQAVADRVELEEIAENELGDEGLAIVLAYWGNMGISYMPKDAYEAVETAREAYAGTFDNWTAWAEQFLEETGMLRNLPEWAKNYFDFEAYGRDARLNGDMFESEGYFFFNQ